MRREVNVINLNLVVGVTLLILNDLVVGFTLLYLYLAIWLQAVLYFTYTSRFGRRPYFTLLILSDLAGLLYFNLLN